MDNTKLQHAGIKGMKWGVRRYQNKDGTLTPAGRKRYGDNWHEDYKKAHSKRKISEMSDTELRSRNNRLQMEKQYRDLTKKTSIGKKAVHTFINTAGTITAVASAYAVYKKFGGKALDAIGDMVISSINLGGSWTK